jgi:hypothetical protein
MAHLISWLMITYCKWIKNNRQAIWIDQREEVNWIRILKKRRSILLMANLMWRKLKILNTNSSHLSNSNSLIMLMCIQANGKFKIIIVQLYNNKTKTILTIMIETRRRKEPEMDPRKSMKSTNSTSSITLKLLKFQVQFLKAI